METFAARLRRALDAADMKPADLAHATDISKAAISEYLAGNYAPKQKNTYKIAQALKVSPSYLLGLDVPMEPAPVVPSPDDLSPREEREIARDLEDMMHSMASAAYEGDQLEDVEAFKATIKAAMIQAKKLAKAKYTPKKYRK